MKEPRFLNHATEIALIMEMGDWIKERYHPRNTYTHSKIGKEIQNLVTVCMHQDIVAQHCEHHQAARISNNQTENMDSSEASEPCFP